MALQDRGTEGDLTVEANAVGGAERGGHWGHPHPANPQASQREALGVQGWLCHISLAALG